MSKDKETIVDVNGVEYDIAEEPLTGEQMRNVRAQVLKSHDVQGVVWDENPRFARLRAEEKSKKD